MASSRQIEATVLGARDIPKVQLLGKQSPYVVIKAGAQEYRSKTHKDGDRDPVFNESFSFVVSEEKSVVEVQLMNDKKDVFLGGSKDDPIGTARVDVTLALHKGELRKAFPVSDKNGQPQGSIDISIKCPVVLKEVQAEAALEALRIKEARERYNEAVVAARAKYYGQVTELMGPHEVVTGCLFDEHFKQVRAIQAEEEKEMGEIFAEPRQKAEELAVEAGKEWCGLAQQLLEDIPETIDEQCKDARARFGQQLQTLTTLISESDARRTQELAAARSSLLAGLDDLLSGYRSRVVTACDRYDETVKAGVLRYKGEVEAVLRSEAEAKALAEAAAGAPPPPAPTISTPTTPPRSPQRASPTAAAAARSPRSPTTGRSPRGSPTVRSPTRMYAAQPSFAYGVAPAPVVPAPVAPAPVAPPPAGFPMTQAERAQADAQAAQEDARRARAQADRAAMEAEQARREAAASQEMMRRQVEAQMRARAVRRGVVGGVLLARAGRRR